MTKKQTNRQFWLGALVGGIVGGVTALLFAPKPGRELRQDIADGAKHATEKTQLLASQFGDKTGELIEAAKEKTIELKRSIHEWRQGRTEDEDEERAEVASIRIEADVQDAQCEAGETDEANEAEDRLGQDEKSFHFNI